MRSEKPDSGTRSPEGPGGAQAIHRAVSVLRTVASAGGQGCRLSDVAATLGLHVATAHRILSTLLSEGLLEQDEGSKLYHLGPELFALGAGDQRRQNLEEYFRPALLHLAHYTEDTIYLSVRSGDSALCLARIEGRFPIRALTLDVGNRRPLGIGAGSLALLAFLDEAEIDRIVKASGEQYESFGITVDEVRKWVRQSRDLDYALNEGRIVAGMTAVGLPVRNLSGRIVAAVSVAAINQRMTKDRRQEIVRRIRMELEQIPPLPDGARIEAVKPGAS